MKTRKWLPPVCITGGVFLLLTIGIIAAFGIMSTKGYGISIGRFYTANIGACLVSDGRVMVMSDQNEDQDLFAGLSAGDLILAVHDGVDDCCPAQTGAYHIIRLCKGDESNLPENFGMVQIHETGLDIPTAQPGHFTDVQYQKGYANLSLKVADGWEYEIEESKDNSDFCIAIWPEGQTEGKIKVWYLNSFGVCGTGLQQEKIRLGSYEADQGTYVGEKVWSFIILDGTPGHYVVMNEGADIWWEEYGNEVMQILGSLAVGEGIITEPQAIEIAKSKARAKYDEIWAEFDSETGIWTMTFFKENSDNDSQTVIVTVSADGSLIDSPYSE